MVTTAKGFVNIRLAVFSLVLNVIIPGLGSIAGGKMKLGGLQLLLLTLVWVLAAINAPNFLVGLAAVSAWLWALTTSVELVKLAAATRSKQ